MRPLPRGTAPAPRRLPARAALLALLAALPFPARALSVEGVSVPDTYTADGTVLHLNGAGVRTLTVFEVKVYVAALYLPQPMHDSHAIEAATGTKVLTLHFLHDGTKAQIEHQYREGEKENCGGGGCAPADGPDFDRLVALAPAVKVGDTTTYVFTAKGVTVMANDRVLASFPNPDLGFRLLNGFLGANPPSKPLRAALLGVAE